MNLEFQFGHPPFNDSNETRVTTGGGPSRQYLFGRLYAIADDKLETFLGYVGMCNPRTEILVYARGEPGEWAEAAKRQEWAHNLERRFPALKGRVFTINIEGGIEKASFRDRKTVAQMKQIVRSILRLPSGAAE